VESTTSKNAIRAANEALMRGNLPLADLIAQELLRAEPGNAFAFNVVGIVAARLGSRDEAIAHFKRALAAAPYLQTARDNLQSATAALPSPHMPKADRYLLIEAWGSGFWADVNHAIGSLLLAEITGRTPITSWGANSLFSDGSSNDAFRFFFRPVSDLTRADIPKLGAADIFPPGKSALRDNAVKMREQGPAGIYFLNRPETLAVSDYYVGVIDLLPWIPASHAMHAKPIDNIYRYLKEKYLQPVVEVADDIENFCSTRIRGRQTIAVHVRGSDKVTEFIGLDRFNESYFALLDAEPHDTQIFLLTEDARLLQAFRERYGARVIATDSLRTAIDTGPHNVAGMDKMRLGREVLADVFIALECDRFLGNGRSNVSASIEILKDWKGNARLLAPSQLREPNLYLHGFRQV